MPIPGFLKSYDASAGNRLLKVVFCKIEKAIVRTGPQDPRTRKTQTPHGIGRALPQVKHR
jgi:hypothetical protein